MTDMTPEILAALKASIEKWERNLAYAKTGDLDKMRIFGKDCPLCQLLTIDDHSEPECERCPVMQKTGLAVCEESPWHKVARARHMRNHKGTVTATQAEIDFLRSLLPDGAP